MDNFELLKLAAKATGRKPNVSQSCVGLLLEDHTFWNPLEDDGDAFRLMLELQIKVEYWPENDSVLCSLPGSMGATTVGAIGDIELRDAIVRAAAEIGRSMP